MMQFIKPSHSSLLKKLPDDFDWKLYVDLNDDVRQVYNSEEAATQHYLYEGHAQNRRYSVKHLPVDFDWKVYLALNRDVYNVCKTRGAAIMHYELHGHLESRNYSRKQVNIPDDFDWEVYRDLNPNYSHSLLCEITSLSHFHVYGRSNNLPYKYIFDHIPINFDWNAYRELNQHAKLHCITELQCKIHYEKTGRLLKYRYCVPAEEIPDDFEWKTYLELNTDVKAYNNSEFFAKVHYYMTGKNEGRIYKLRHTPKDFDWELYLELNDSIPEQYTQSEIAAKLHYDLFGVKDGLMYIAKFQYVPDDFNWEHYVILNPDIATICTSEIRAKLHFDRYGIYQSRKYIQTEADNVQPSADMERQKMVYAKFPHLFHKYLLGISTSQTPMNYNVLSSRSASDSFNHNIVAHLHCYNIDKFEHFYSNYLNVIALHCSFLVVTFSVGNELNLPKYDNMAVIHVSNVGMDIGGKYVCVDFLKKKSIDYKYILFLHSKQDDSMRKAYWEPLLLNMAQIVRIMQTDEQIGIFVPPLIFMGDYANIIYKEHFIDPKNVTCKWNLGNSLYMNDMDRYYQYQSKNFLFPEGNCFVSNRAIAEKLYGDASMYNLLNTATSFDAVWVKAYYGGRTLKDVGQNIYEVFRFFRTHRSRERIYPNNIAWGAGHKGHADNMIEHSYERMVFKVVQKLGYRVKIMPWVTHSTYLTTLDNYNREVNEMLKNSDL
jgi:hypothetical protein